MPRLSCGRLRAAMMERARGGGDGSGFGFWAVQHVKSSARRRSPPTIFSQCHERKSVPRQKKPQIGYGTMSRGPLKTEIHCEIVEIRIIVDCIKYEMNNCNTLSLFIFFILGDLSPLVSRRQQNRFVVLFFVALTSARGTD